jgi:aspartyl-tRNA(Asn)/glutamyl-tRNA(Gln) amidotransferase subunit C
VGIDRATVDHVAWLARLALSDAEREALRDQLSAILEHINVIAEADTSQVPATAHILPVQNVMAPDIPSGCVAPETLLANAPEQEDSYFRVEAILEEE